MSESRVSSHDSVEEIAKRIASETGGFTGGPIDRFGLVGRQTFMSLKAAGARSSSRVLDVGCGALRLGYWLVRFLEPDCYCGLDPNPKYVQAGLKHAIGEKLAMLKRPRFDHNMEFDFSVFGVKFDYVIARSIFSHTSPEQVCKVLESFRDNASDTGVMLVSYRPLKKDEQGEKVVDVNKFGEWSWRRYGKLYLKQLAQERGLFAGNFGKPFNGQVWLRVSKQDLSAAKTAGAENAAIADPDSD
jgi:SAM-dependent methyltransferase